MKTVGVAYRACLQVLLDLVLDSEERDGVESGPRVVDRGVDEVACTSGLSSVDQVAIRQN